MHPPVRPIKDVTEPELAGGYSSVVSAHRLMYLQYV